MDDIVYLKLTNGDELFAIRIGEEGDKVFLSDVMVMETIQTDGDMKYLFMSRYTQYGTLHSMALEKSNIIFIQDASAVVKNHYRISVQYAEKISDNRFNEGITEASNYLSKVLTKDDKKRSNENESFETVKDRVLGKFESNSNTKH